MKARATLLALLLVTLTFGILAPSAHAAATGFVPISPQPVLDAAGTTVGNITAVKITHVTNTASGLVASGVAVVNTVTGGTVLSQFTNAPLAASGTCPILHLTIGPINLNLLGLMVHTNQIVLDITAQSGPGNLLGNLLCAVSNLLNGSSVNLNQVAALLNQILALL